MLRSGRCIGSWPPISRSESFSQSARPSPVHQARAGGHGAEPDLTSWRHHQADGAERQVDVLPSTSCSPASIFSRTRSAGWSHSTGRTRRWPVVSSTRDLPQTGRPAEVLTLHLTTAARRWASKCTGTTARRPRRDPFNLSRPQVSDDNPFSEAQFKTLKYHAASLAVFHDITAAIASSERSSLGRTPNIAMAGSPCSPRTTWHHNRTQSVLEQRGRTPSSRLDPSSRTLRSRDPTTGSPSPSRLDQPTCDTHNRRNCSVNRNRHCLKVD